MALLDKDHDPYPPKLFLTKDEVDALLGLFRSADLSPKDGTPLLWLVYRLCWCVERNEPRSFNLVKEYWRDRLDDFVEFAL